jgi:hypothetical protein
MKNKLFKSCLICAIILQTACTSSPVKGKWQYDGGVYNGKPIKPSPELIMQQTYNNNSYEAFVLERGLEPQKYAGGNYEIKGDTLKVTGTYSSQATSQSFGKTIDYQFKIDNNRLTIKGILPNGMQIEEYWKKAE